MEALPAGPVLLCVRTWTLLALRDWYVFAGAAGLGAADGVDIDDRNPAKRSSSFFSFAGLLLDRGPRGP